MKITILVIFLLGLKSAAQEPREMVQYHLKKVEMVIQNQESTAKIRSLENSTNAPVETETPRYIPNFGVGDEGMIVDSEPHVCTSACDLPRALTLQEKIQKEAAERSISEYVDTSKQRQDFIDQFKKNAAKKGVKIEVDNKSLQVREIK